MILNVYSCGCCAIDVPVVSSCSEHGGYVMTATRDVVPLSDRCLYTTKDKNTTLVFANFSEAIRKLPDSSMGTVISYQNPFPLYCRLLADNLTEFHYANPFIEYARVLRDDGNLFLVVDSDLIDCAFLFAEEASLIVSDVKTVLGKILDSPDSGRPHDKLRGKIAVRFTKRPLIRNRLKAESVNEVLIDALNMHESGPLLDPTCIHYPFVLNARKKVRTIGLVDNRQRFLCLKSKLART